MTGSTLLTAMSTKKTVVEIDLEAIMHNLSLIKEMIGKDRKILLPVKADGYGHGAIQVARAAEKNRLADIFGVSSPEEGIELREAGIYHPILILGLVLPCQEAIDNVVNYDFSQTVADMELSRKISETAGGKMKKAKLHLKIDTGMGRIGCRADEAVDLAKKISELENIELEGVFSHFPAADEPDSDFTRNQIKIFEDIIKKIEKTGTGIKYRHMANSAAIFNYKGSIFNLARPGIAAYGYRPSRDFNSAIGLVPAMTFKSYIIFRKRVKTGTPLSYGLTYKTERDSNIATVPVGYGDGYNRLLSNRGSVIIRDKMYPVVGRVCMDQILVNLGDDEYPIGEEVVLFGKKDVTVETVAETIGTIPYEVTCAISKRVRRVYK